MKIEVMIYPNNGRPIKIEASSMERLYEELGTAERVLEKQS